MEEVCEIGHKNCERIFGKNVFQARNVSHYFPE